IVRPRVRSGRSGIDIHGSHLKSSEHTCDLGSSVDGYFLPRDWIDSDLPAEKELVRVTAGAHGKRKDARVLQEELPFLRKEQFVGSEIELLNIHVAIGEVCVSGKIRHQVGTEPHLDIHTASVKCGRPRGQTA